MIKSDFYIGQKIIFAGFVSGSPTAIGTVTHIKSTFVYFDWIGPMQYPSRLKAPSTFARMTPVEEDITSIKNNLVTLRIKKLWNNSNWVLKNPSQAY